MGQEQSGLGYEQKGVARAGTLVSNRSQRRAVSMSQYSGSTSQPQRVPTPTTSPPPYAIQDPSPTVQTNPFLPDLPPRDARQPVGSPTTSGGAYVRRNVSATVQPSPPVAGPHRRTMSQGEYGRPSTRERYVPSAVPVIPETTAPIGQSVQRQDTRASFRPTPINSPRANSVHMSGSPTSVMNSPRTPSRRSSVEDPLLQLVKYDTVIIVDDSSSMAGPLWFEAREALAGVAELASKYDADGIDIYFLNSPLVGNGLRHASEVKRLFDQVEPDGITPTGEKLEELLLDYLLRLEHAKERADAGDHSALREIKPVNYLVITDGAPSDDPETVIVTAARRLDAGKFPITQVGIQFIQIGNDPDAGEALRELDDDLAGKYGVRDIVDTTLYSGNQLDATVLTKCLLGGINRRVDRRPLQARSTDTHDHTRP